MQRRLPKRGFTPLDKVQYSIVNLGQLEVFDAGTVVDAAALIQKGLVGKIQDGIKILAKGTLSKSLTIKANKFSSAAKEQIIAAGGVAEEF
jgi:large subunit ribosomal protein L15